jgi:glycosyltransferase involved in cell wall biosynthesis
VVLVAQTSKENGQEDRDVYNYYSVEPIFEIRRFSKPGIYGGRMVYDLKILLELVKHGYDLVYSRYLEGCFISTLLGYKTILEAHDPFWKEFGKLRNDLLDRILKSKALRGVVVISEELRKVFIKRSVRAVNTIVAPDGADLPRTKEIINLGGRAGHLQVGYTGHLYKGKGMEIIEQLAPLLDDVDFHVVGGLDRDISFWKDRIRCSNVYFHGFVKPRLISNYINAFDVCLLPIQSTVFTYSQNPGGSTKVRNIANFTSPLKLFEYMAHGKAIVASDLPVLREVLNEDIAMLVKPEDITGWMKAIDALRNKQLRTEISAKAFKYFTEKYSWEQRARSLLHLLV